MNNVVLIGRLTRDPELRYTTGANQTAVATFTLAIDRPQRAGQDKQTDFIRITVFGRQAENCERYLAKGRQAAVQGRIQTGSYQNKDGQTVYTTDVVANNVEFLGGGQSRNDGYGGEPYQNQYSQPAPQQYAPRQEQNNGGFGGGNDEIPEGFQAIQDDDIPF